MFNVLEFGDYGHVFYLDTNYNHDEFAEVRKVIILSFIFKPLFLGAIRRHCQWHSGHVKYAEEG